jgi:hypothetical protein
MHEKLKAHKEDHKACHLQELLVQYEKEERF